MCGINGLIGFSNAKKIIEAMNETLKHRGPDASGEWVDGNVALGHRRLSIIDLSAEANQPFIKGGLAIVYNGEIYNFTELRKELEDEGVNFRTHSDTEVILELFRVYREKSFDKLSGMFAFCIYDIQHREMFLVRDHFGIKPLFYTQAGTDKFVFSSELKALQIVPGMRKDLNPHALVSCINYLWIYGNDTAFKNVYKLAPAHYLHLRIDNQKFSIKRYWELKLSQLQLPEEMLIEKLKDILEKSIKRHLIADVPVGGFLSGGLDSSLVSVIAKKFNKNLSTYTISIGKKEKRIEKMPDDNIYAQKVAAMFDINHQDIAVNPMLVENLRGIIYSLDEPIGDPAAINTYLICKAAKERGIKVLLSGMGADEIFAGYRRQYATLLAGCISRWHPVIKNGIRRALGVFPVRIGDYGVRPVRWAKRFFSFMDMPIDEAYMRSYSYYNKDELYRLFNYQFNGFIDEMHEYHRKIFYSVKEIDDINRMCYTDINMFMPGLNLTYTDRASMAASVEVRVPYIDKEMAEFAMSIRGDYKIRGGVSKYLLKKAATAYLPKDIIYRPKASFGMPLRAWISGDLRELVNDILSEQAIKKRNILNPGFVKEIIDNDRRGIEDNAYRIYQFITLELWMREFIDG